MAAYSYKIDGIEVRGPDKIKPTDNDVSRSYEDMDAIFRDKLIRRKRAVDWIYSVISDEEYQQIKKITDDKIFNKGSRYFMVTTQVPGEGMVTSLYYLGATVASESLFGTGETGVTHWNLTLSWVEVIGRKINSPNTMPK